MAASTLESTLIGLSDGAVDPHRHPPSYLTNKVGGLPDVLPRVSWRHPRCRLCGAALAHVVQVYCPLAASPYHRNLHLFACPSSACGGTAESWKVLRSQGLETEVTATTAASHPTAKQVPLSTTDWCDGADDWGVEDADDDGGGGGGGLSEGSQTPEEAGGPAASEVQVSSRLQDLSLGGPEQDVPVLRPFYISVVDEWDLGGEEEDLEHARKLLREYEKREGAVEEGGGGDEGGGEKYEKTKARHGDAVFSRFMKKISLCPEQILRYRWDGEPLFVSEPPSNVARMVPVCHSCGSARTFELQLMPALVSLLQGGGSEVELDFGTVLVYTCRESCWTPGSTSPTEEFALIQTDPDQRFFK
ncbi:programmed cell death protein 2-like [Diretmus argenteus]